MPAAATDCFVCRKQRGEVDVPGGALYRDDLVYASHGALDPKRGTSYPGVLFVEPLRHVPGLADLSDAESQRVGLIASRLARALEQVAGAERVYLHALGHHVPHLHVWVVPRYPGTPDEVGPFELGRWPDAPRAKAPEIISLCDRLRSHLDSESA